MKESNQNKDIVADDRYFFMAKRFRVHLIVVPFGNILNTQSMKLTNEKAVIDGIDKEILRCLMRDARTPILEIARKVGVSGAAIHQRIRKLEAAALFSGSKVVINPKALGYTTLAFIGIYLDKAARNAEAVKALHEIPEVLECHYTTGNWSMLIKILCKDNEHLMKVLNHHIQTIEGVSRTETFISLNQQIDRQISL
jgi:Lrp/AsnC family transcriptional regulator, regulator for asnA, asnC and gidA